MLYCTPLPSASGESMMTMSQGFSSISRLAPLMLRAVVTGQKSEGGSMDLTAVFSFSEADTTSTL
jgi:hypothetical protein